MEKTKNKSYSKENIKLLQSKSKSKNKERILGGNMELKVEYMNTADLKPYANNAKIHTAEQIDQIKKSIEEFGMNDPIAIWKNNEIIEGHGRLIACSELGIENVPVIRLDDLTDEQRRAYMLVHNQLTMNTGFDSDVLNIELDDISLDMSEYGFDDNYELIDNSNDAKEEYEYFSSDQIKEKIVEKWKSFSLDEFISNIIDEPTAMFQFNRLCSGYDDGYNISLLFNPHRFTTNVINNNSNILDGFNKDDTYKKQFARFMIDVQKKCVPPTQYYKFVGIGTAGYQYVNEFQPYLARDIYKRYCKNGYKILNPCAGWGGRIIGLASCLFENIEYVETDPSKETYNGLVKLKKWLNLGENYKQYNLPFEELELKDNYFDFVFTSPPYFNTEMYSDDDSQAYKKADSYKEWKTLWYYPMIDKIIKCMKKGAYCVLNVGNARYPMEKDAVSYLNKKYEIHVENVMKNKIGGNGIGARTGEDGEPFIAFRK